MQFMPTGGVNPDNLLEYLSIPSVLACGGSWLTPKDAVESKNYDTITRLAAEAIELSKVR
jgi:2-dehydro-3-deoxyphosphogluconate aldolase/(4S)-4-hydroxy-2-oxoglutarate aldolase